MLKCLREPCHSLQPSGTVEDHFNDLLTKFWLLFLLVLNRFIDISLFSHSKSLIYVFIWQNKAACHYIKPYLVSCLLDNLQSVWSGYKIWHNSWSHRGHHYGYVRACVLYSLHVNNKDTKIHLVYLECSTAYLHREYQTVGHCLPPVIIVPLVTVLCNF